MQTTSLADRLRKCIELIGNGDESARQTGIPRSTLETYLTGNAEPKASRLAIFCHVAGVSGHWLLTGEGEMLIANQAEATTTHSSASLALLSTAIAGVEIAIAHHAVEADADKRAALIMLAYKTLLRGNSASILDELMADVIQLLPPAKAAAPLAEDEAVLLREYRAADQLDKSLILGFVRKKQQRRARPSEAAG